MFEIGESATAVDETVIHAVVTRVPVKSNYLSGIINPSGDRKFGVWVIYRSKVATTNQEPLLLCPTGVTVSSYNLTGIVDAIRQSIGGARIIDRREIAATKQKTMRRRAWLNVLEIQIPSHNLAGIIDIQRVGLTGAWICNSR